MARRPDHDLPIRHSKSPAAVPLCQVSWRGIYPPTPYECPRAHCPTSSSITSDLSSAGSALTSRQHTFPPDRSAVFATSPPQTAPIAWMMISARYKPAPLTSKHPSQHSYAPHRSNPFGIHKSARRYNLRRPPQNAIHPRSITTPDDTTSPP